MDIQVREARSRGGGGNGTGEEHRRRGDRGGLPLRRVRRSWGRLFTALLSLARKQVRAIGNFRENANLFRSGDAALKVTQAEGEGAALKERKRMVSLMVLLVSLVALRAARSRTSLLLAGGRARALALMFPSREGIPSRVGADNGQPR